MKKYKIVVSALMVLLFISACSTDTKGDKNDTASDENQVVTPSEETPSEETPPEETPPEETPGNDTADTIDSQYFKSGFEVNFDEFEIFDKFTEDYKGIEITEYEMSLKNEGYVYEIEGILDNEEYEAEYNAASGELIQLEQETEDSKKPSLVREDLNQLKDHFKLVFDDAGENYHLKEWTLKHKNDKKVIEFEVLNDNNNEIEYKYDFNSQELLEKDQ